MFAKAGEKLEFIKHDKRFSEVQGWKIGDIAIADSEVIKTK